jgi:hypothetical protein
MLKVFKADDLSEVRVCCPDCTKGDETGKDTPGYFFTLMKRGLNIMVNRSFLKNKSAS